MKNITSQLLRVSLVIAFLISNAAAHGQNKNEIISFTNDLKKTETEEISEPLRIIKDNGSMGIDIEYQFSNAEVATLTVENKSYNFIHIKGFNKMQQAGAPALPAHYDNIAVPLGATAMVTITEAEYIEYSGYYIHPALKPASDTYGAREPEFEIDEKIYNTDKLFPENIINVSATKKLRGITIASVRIVPVQFNPVTKTIRVYSKIRYTISFRGAKKLLSETGKDNSGRFIKKIKNIVLNNSQLFVQNSDISNAEPAGYDYIIITHSQYLEAAQKLAEWKSQLGYTVEIVSQANWTSDQVKAAIQQRYENYTPKPDYFVIIGDHDGSYAVPGELLYNHDDPPALFASDLYYACTDGADDYVPDIAYGRIPVTSLEEANIVVDKIINYEKSPPLSSVFYSTMTNCALFQDGDINDEENQPDGYADRRFAQTAEEALQYMESQGYNVNRVYTVEAPSIDPQYWNNTYYSNGEEIPSYLRKPSFAWDGDKNDIVDEVNNGRFLILHRDHGYTSGTGWASPQFLTSDISLLSNGDLLPVLFSINCFTGAYMLPKCFAEGWLRGENKGAVGVIGASSVSYSGYNDAFTTGMYDAIWPGWEIQFTGTGNQHDPPYITHDNIFSMGDVMIQGLFRMTESWGDPSELERYEYEIFHWFGDPAMQIWTSNPNNDIITATHNSSVSCDASSLAISSSTAGSVATLVFNKKLIGKTVLDNSGNGIINFNIPSEGSTAILTISKHNCKPYIATISITGSCSFPPTVSTGTASNVTSNTATVGGVITSNGGSEVTSSGVVYSLIPNPLSGSPGSTDIPTNPVVSSGTFTLNISGLDYGSTYFYKAYAINAVDISYGETQTFQTTCESINIPYSEDFESGTMPKCWTQEDVLPNWQFITGDGSTHPSDAHGGLYNACLKDNSIASNTNKLVSPPLNLSSATNPVLRFWHTQQVWITDQDELKIYYKTSEAGSWNLIASYEDNITDWTCELVPLPEPSDNYYIAFEGDAKYGYGVCLDDIEIFDLDCSSVSIAQASDFESSNITANSANISWTRGSGDEVLVVCHQNDPVNADPLSGRTYNANAAFGSGEQTGTGNYVIYRGTGTQAQVSNLNPNTTYHFSVYEYSSEACYKIPALTGNITTYSCTDYSIPFDEKFEDSLFPPLCWESYRGENGLGTENDWVRTTTSTYNSSAGAAHVHYENVTGGSAEDWLVSPKITIPAGTPCYLSYYEKQTYSTNYGSQFYIKISTASQTDIESFVDVSSYDESTFGTTYSQRSIDLSLWEGQQVYIAFVMVQDDGDSWYIDNINVSNTPTDIFRPESSEDINIYPVPVSGILIIESTTEMESVIITGITGDLIMKLDKLNKNFLEIDMNPYCSGVYFIQIKQKSKKQLPVIRKIIKM